MSDEDNGTIRKHHFTFLARFSVEGSPSLASDSSNTMSEFDSSTTCKTKQNQIIESENGAADEGEGLVSSSRDRNEEDMNPVIPGGGRRGSGRLFHLYTSPACYRD